MLVLTRRAGESIIVNDVIELKVLRIKGRQVHIGIDAPASTAVHRKEVWERIRATPGTGLEPMRATQGADGPALQPGAD